MQTVDFSKIAPRNGSPNDAFEELCCQLAHRTSAPDSAFDRFRGSGGDGGIECLERTKDGRVIGWQAKYVFSVKNLIAQADESLTTALTIHHLSEFVLCYPFNPTPPTGKQTRAGKRASSDYDKLNEWVAKRTQRAQSLGHHLTITLMSGSRLEALLHEHDPKGGLREYFFNATILSPEWFGQHLERAANAAEPRYSPDLKLDTPLYRWFQAFEAGPAWKEEVQQKLHRLDEAIKQFCMSASSISGDHAKLPALSTTTEPSLSCLEMGKAALQNMTRQSLGAWIENAHTALEEHRRFVLEVRNTQLHLKRNQRWESPLLPFLESLVDWLESPTCFLGFHRVFVLTGEGGSGKTHGICDMALKRLAAGACSCVLFGHQFEGQPTEWVRVVESLGLPNSLGQDALLDALNSAAEASGHTLILWIDAVNETAPRDYWRKRLKAFAGHVSARPLLRLCVSCRTSFKPVSLPETHDYPELEHHGFEGMERLACKKFFEHYGLTPPLAPILQPEMGNPLYLKLVCQTLKDRVKCANFLDHGIRHKPYEYRDPQKALQQ